MTEETKRGLVALAILILILLLFSCFYVKVSWALAPEYAVSWENELNWFILKNPKYVMDDKIKPDDPIKLGVDCSRYMYLSARRAGIPVLRTTAYGMAMGNAGWVGNTITVDEANHLDLVWWTFKPTRQHGHVGAFFVDSKIGLLQTTHASEKRGVVLEQLKGVLITTISAVRHLTIGD
jgi:hypothetical protein